jgi:1-deoxy-D-xylulose-5-phosphate reductoisomerase
MKKIAILGSTGSIGQSTLDVIKHLDNEFSVFALAAKSNYHLLAQQTLETNPKVVVTSDKRTKDELFKLIKHRKKNITILTGEQGLIEVATASNTDILVMAMSGISGITALIKAIEKRKRIAFSTKELLVSFGDIIMAKAKKYNAEILPIDSELVGLHQCLDNCKTDDVKEIIITASGGPFRNRTNFKNITVADALKHPIWKMGRKITIDSSTLANKGLEVIESSRLFSINPKKIKVLIHPQSIVHSMVKFIDNTVLSALSLPDMRVCIQYALTYPSRRPSLVGNLDLSEYKKLEFYKPDFIRFPLLRSAYQVAKTGGIGPCIFNAANETAVNAFLQGKIEFDKISEIVKKVLSHFTNIKNPSLSALIQYDMQAAEYTEKLINICQ